MISLRDEKMPRITIHICHFSQTLGTKEVSPVINQKREIKKKKKAKCSGHSYT